MSTDLHWFKSSYSSDQGECVEAATRPATIHIRDSKQPHAPALTVTAPAWTAFLATLR
ncbi:DUF397 domain-containing protein [Streptomyces sp. NPDC102360]|uniref:DUF397 domain-containing protein n=1 Tax=Streptomyces sp. NPDC102360 TaxID=3366160 RepID=UPI0038223632